MTHVLTIEGIHYRLEADRLRVVQYGDGAFEVSLSPTFDGTTVPIRSWELAGPNSFVASLGE